MRGIGAKSLQRTPFVFRGETGPGRITTLGGRLQDAALGGIPLLPDFQTKGEVAFFFRSGTRFGPLCALAL